MTPAPLAWPCLCMENGGHEATPGAAGRPPAAAAGDAEAPTECSPAPKDQPAALVQPSRDSTSGRPQAQPVALRVELATKKEAQIMQWVLVLLVLLLVVLSIILVCFRSDIQSKGDEPRSELYHKVCLGLACGSMFALLVVAALYISRVRQSLKNKLIWPRRHVALALDAAVVQCLVILVCACWLASLATILANPCQWPTQAVAALAMVRQTFFILLMFWLAAMMHGMTLARHALPVSLQPPAPSLGVARPANGKSPLSVDAAPIPAPLPAAASSADAPAGSPLEAGKLAGTGAGKAAAEGVEEDHGDEEDAAAAAAAAAGRLLVIDRPWRDQLRFHIMKIVIWVALEVLIILEGVKQTIAGGRYTFYTSEACAVAAGAPAAAASANNCGLNGTQKWGGLAQAILIVLYFIAYVIYQHRAFRDHTRLPYVRYRMTQLYIRVQARHTTVVMLAVVLSVLVGRVAATGGDGSCWSFLENQVGSMTTQLSLVILALVSGILYMPLGGVGSTLLQSWLQEFAWTDAGMDKALRRRLRHMETMGGLNHYGAWERGARKLALAMAPHLAPLVMQSDQQALAAAEAELAKQPMLSIELVLRTFYWARLAYAVQAESHVVKPDTALALFGLQHYEVIYEPISETLGVVGWGGPGSRRIVLSFRGTSNMQNVLTDIKFWKVPHLPERWHHGRKVLVHSGFYAAWLTEGFNQRVLSKVGEIVESLQVEPSQLTIYVTGHSLGGALAILAAYDVQQRWPQSRMRVYTFGAPRVGNGAWTSVYNAAVPDTWCLVNHNDPVPRIPKVLYKRSGQRVTINSKGDIIVRPSYFELSVILKRGGTVKDHMTGTYAQALASILKAQFSGAKALPGGERGVVQLEAAVDVGEALVLANCGLEALRDPALQPEPLELLRKKEAGQQGRKSKAWMCSCGGSDSGDVQQEVAKPAGKEPPSCTEPSAAAAATGKGGGEVGKEEAVHNGGKPTAPGAGADAV